MKGQTPRSGGTVWVEEVKADEFTVCVFEFGNGSNKTTEINWLALQAAPPGSQMGTYSLEAWTTGTKCEIIDFHQV